MAGCRRKNPAAGLAAALLTVMAAGTARAEYQVCNQSKLAASIAIAYHEDKSLDGVDNGAWVSEGWWNLDPGKCGTLIAGPLTVRYIYLYAESTDGSNWGGDKAFCTKTAEFTIKDQATCEARGLTTTRFLEVDTGGASKTYTTNLTE